MPATICAERSPFIVSGCVPASGSANAGVSARHASTKSAMKFAKPAFPRAAWERERGKRLDQRPAMAVFAADDARSFRRIGRFEFHRIPRDLFADAISNIAKIVR